MNLLVDQTRSILQKAARLMSTLADAGFNGYGFKIYQAEGIAVAELVTEGEGMDPGSEAGMTEREEGCRKRKREDRVGAGSGSAWASPRFLAEPRNDSVLGVGLGGLPVEIWVAGGLRLV